MRDLQGVAVFLALACVTIVSPARTTAAREPVAQATARDPLPVEAAASLQRLIGHDLSPDGLWLAYTYQDTDDDKRRVRLEEVHTGRMLEVAPAEVSSHGPAWSPDSQKLAFQSDQGGDTRLWIWERATGQARPVAGPTMGSPARWFADSTRLLVPLRPEGDPPPATEVAAKAEAVIRPPFEKVAPGAASVYVLRANFAETERGDVNSRAGKAESSDKPCRRLIGSRCDLAVVSLSDASVNRVAARAHVAMFYQPSPDGRHVAYTVFKGADPVNQDQRFDLMLVTLASGEKRALATDLRPYGGMTVSWSPDSRHLAYVSLLAESRADDRFARGEGDLGIASISGGARSLKRAGLPNFDFRRIPLWERRSKNIYAVTVDGDLWRIDIDSGRGGAAPVPADYDVINVVAPNDSRVLWPKDQGNKIFVTAVHHDRTMAGVFELDLDGGTSRKIVEKAQDIAAGATVDASDATGTITFTASDQQHPLTIWLLDPRRGEVRPAARANPQFGGYRLGEARLIHWRTSDGNDLRGALLLPPGYEPGRRLPLVAWVYGGDMGSEKINGFGLEGDSPKANFHVLATRGYAVLFPDAPLRLGHPVEDMIKTIMPGVNAAIEQGYADPDRLAVMGHSYGSYSTLALITQTTRFKAAVISGVVDPDLVSGYLRMAPGGNSVLGMFENGQMRMGGTPWQHPERYRDNSPVFRFNEIATPLLIGQGEIDAATPMRGADSVFVALQRLGKPVEYRVYEGEGHDLRRKAHIVDFWNRRLEFLAGHLDLALERNGAIIFENGRAKSRSVH